MTSFTPGPGRGPCENSGVSALSPECLASRGGFQSGMRRSVLVVVLCLAGGLASPPARAELVVFEDGRVVKASGYRLLGEELEISLPGGGSYRVALSRVDRIVDDEVLVDAVLVEGGPSRPSPVYDLSYKPGRGPGSGSAYAPLIEREARRQNIDAWLVSALIRAESNFEPRAVSRKGARGLMQLMPATAKRLSVGKPFDPAANIRGGVAYLRELVDRFGQRPQLVLAAYNAGEQAVESYGGVPPYRETVAYVNRIMGWWQSSGDEASRTGSATVAADR